MVQCCALPGIATHHLVFYSVLVVRSKLTLRRISVFHRLPFLGLFVLVVRLKLTWRRISVFHRLPFLGLASANYSSPRSRGAQKHGFRVHRGRLADPKNIWTLTRSDIQGTQWDDCAG